MFKALFFAFVLATLTVNIIFLFAAKDKPPDPTGSTTTLVSVIGQGGSGGTNGAINARWAASMAPDARSQPATGRRLFLRSNDFYDYPSAAVSVALDSSSNQLQLVDNNQSSSSSQRAPIDKLDSRSSLERAKFLQGEVAPEVHHIRAASMDGRHQAEAESNSFTPQPPIWLDANNDGQEQTNKPGLLSHSPSSAWLKQKRRDRPEASTLRSQRPASDSFDQASPQPENEASAKGGDNATGLNTNNNHSSSRLAPASQLNNELASGNKEPKSSNGNINDETANEITRFGREQAKQAPDSKNEPRAGAACTLAIRVKSSKNHVLIKVDNLIIYESGSSGLQRNKQQQQQQHGNGDKTLFATASTFDKPASRRRARRTSSGTSRSSVAASTEDKNANQLASSGRADAGNQPAVDSSTAADTQTTTTTTTTITTPGRGIHVLVLNQFDGFVMSKRLFDTYSPQQDDELALYLGQIQDGRLVIMAVQDEASFKMARSSSARRLIESALGSRHIMDLDWRDMWALVGVKRQGDFLETNQTLGERSRFASSHQATHEPLAEGHSRSARFTDWAPPVELATDFRLESRNDALQAIEKQCFTALNANRNPNQDSLETERRRRSFCDRIEGYGRVCDCRHPSRLDFTPSRLEHSQIDEVPVVVIASNRPYYLYRMLRSLLQATGVQRSMVTVFIDGFYDEPAEICKLLNLRYVQNKPESSRSARISHHYKTSLMLTFEHLFPSAQFAIIFEEDLDVAEDALVYFNQTKPLLDTDPSLYCVSAWNDQGYEHSVGNLRQLLRVETMPGLGWMLSRRLFVDELKNKWPSSGQQHDWDMWIRTAQVRRGRECIIPDVSRTYHFGSTGTNINSYFQRQYFNKHAFSDNLLAPGKFEFDDLDRLDAVGYEQLIEQLLEGRQQDDSIVRQWFSSNDRPEQQSNRDEIETASPKNQTLVNIPKQALCAYATSNNPTNQLANRILGDNNKLHRSQLDKPQTTKHKHLTSTLNVIFIKMIDSEDYGNWLKLAKCWRLWDLDARGQHKSMWRLYANGQQTLVVGHPASPYSKFKPAQVVPYDF